MPRLCFDPGDPRHRPRADRGAARLSGWSLILGVVLLAAGCDTFTFTPPRPAELAGKAKTPRAGAGEATATPSSRTIEVVLLPRIEADVESLKTAARLQAGIDKVRIQVSAPPEGAAASEQVELVRQALARKPPVIVIESPTEPDAGLMRAVADARKAGVAVVSVGKPLSNDPPTTEPVSSGRPLVAVANKPLKDSAATLVMDAMRVAKTGKIPTDTGAVILVDPTVDSLVQERVDALREALTTAGNKHIEELKFERTIKDGEEKLVAYLNEHPETTLVFAVDAGGVLAADDATGVLKEKHRYAIAGYSGNEAAKNQVFMNEYAAIGVASIDRLLRRAVNIAAGLLMGKVFPDRIEIDVPVLESSDTAGLPRMKVAPPDKPSMMKKVPSISGD